MNLDSKYIDIHTHSSIEVDDTFNIESIPKSMKSDILKIRYCPLLVGILNLYGAGDNPDGN